MIDAATSVEVCLAEVIRRVMRHRGSTDDEVDQLFENTIVRPQHRITYLDKLARSVQTEPRLFEGSDVYRRWKRQLAELRHDIVHRGKRHVEADAAVTAVSAGMEATIYIEQMMSDFVQGVRWAPESARLENVRPGVEKLFRLFDA